MIKLCRCLCASAALVATATALFAEAPTSAPWSILIDATTGSVLFEHRANEQFAPGGMTKMMTLLVAFEELRSKALSPDAELSVSEHAWRDGGAPSRSPSLLLPPYATVPLLTLLDGVAIASANDAAIAVAEGVAGTESAFVSRMNDEAHRLGLQDTTFANATGFSDPRHRTSARDLANLAQYLVREFPESYSAFGRPELLYRGVRFTNRNPLVLGGLADGVSTGFVEGTGYGMVASVVRHGRRLIGVVMGTKSATEREAQMRNLLAWGFGDAPEAQAPVPGPVSPHPSAPTFECRNYFPAAGVVLAVACVE